MLITIIAVSLYLSNFIWSHENGSRINRFRPLTDIDAYLIFIILGKVMVQKTCSESVFIASEITFVEITCCL